MTNSGGDEPGGSFNLADLFAVVAEAVPDREAVVDDGRRFTYSQLAERSLRLAAALRADGIGAGDTVGLLLYNGVEYLEAMLAAFWLRAVPINLNYRYTPGELAEVANDAQLRALLHEPDLQGTVDAVIPLVGSLRSVSAIGESYEQRLSSTTPLDPDEVPDRSGCDHYVLYTGGTTGRPKGVIWHHEDIFFAAMGGGGVPAIDRPADLADRASDGRGRLLPACPFIHGTAHWMAFHSLFRGGTVVVDGSPSFDAARVWERVVAERVSFLVIVGDAFARPLVEARRSARARDLDVSSLTVILSGGAILSPTVRDDLLDALPGCMVVDGFGASETGGQGQMVAVNGHDSAHPRFRMDDTSAVLGDDLRPIAAGSGLTGRLARRGRVPLGYLGDPEGTSIAFPIVDGVRWAVLGDEATVESDGTITVFGRGAVSINTGGEKVHPEEVESALKSHGDVFDAVVVGVADERWGERVTAVVEIRDGATPPPSPLELADHVRARLAGYKVPRSIVMVGYVERTASGKADYRWARGVVEAAGDMASID